MSQQLTRGPSNVDNPLWKEGLVHKRERGIIKATWKDRFMIVFDGSLFVYTNKKDLTPKRVIHLLNFDVVSVPEKKFKQKYAFSVQSKNDEFVFSADNDQDLTSWMSFIKANVNATALPPGPKESNYRNKSAAVYIAGKVLDTIMNLGVGGKLVRDRLSDEMILIIDSATNFLVQRIGEEKARKIEKQALSLAVKVALLQQEKKNNERCPADN